MWKHLRLLVLLAAVAGPFHAAVPAQEHRHDNERALEALVAALGAGPGSVIADVGAGDGAYTVPLSRVVGQAGRIIAVDISPRALERLRARLAREGVTNAEVIHGDVDSPRLTPGSLDAVLIMNAYHEMTDHQAMLTHIRAALKPTGRLVISDSSSTARRSQPRENQTSRHEIAPELVQQDARAAGFSIIGLEDPFRPGHGHQEHEGWLLTLVPSAGGPLDASSR